MEIFLVICTVLGGVAALWYFKDQLALSLKKKKESKVVGYEIEIRDDEKFIRPDVEEIFGIKRVNSSPKISGKVVRVPASNEPENLLYSYIKVMLDARYRYEETWSCCSNDAVLFVDIDIDDGKCYWRRLEDRLKEIQDTSFYSRLGFRREVIEKMKLADESFRHISDEARDLYKAARYYFHHINVAWQGSANPEKRSKDPYLDVSISNVSSDPIIVKKISVIPLALWSKPKAVPLPVNLPLHDVYRIPIDYSKKACSAKLKDPIYVPPHAPFRFQLCFPEYSESVTQYAANESLLAIAIYYNDTCAISEPIYLGILS